MRKMPPFPAEVVLVWVRSSAFKRSWGQDRLKAELRTRTSRRDQALGGLAGRPVQAELGAVHVGDRAIVIGISLGQRLERGHRFLRPHDQHEGVADAPRL